MNPTDRDLGMDRPISRRDLLHGMGALAVSSLVPGRALADETLALERAGVVAAGYPPALTGMRGSHAGSFEVAHQLARDGRREWGAIQEPDSDLYDLVVVGGGISGLAVAHFYRKRQPKARILILDNHDDFGGHAKRNEFHQGGDMRLAMGGSQYLAHWFFSATVDELMRNLGVDIEQLLATNEFRFGRNGREGPAIWFDETKFGVNRLVTGCDLAGNINYDMLAAIDAFPIGEDARAQLKAFYDKRTNVLTGLRKHRLPQACRS